MDFLTLIATFLGGSAFTALCNLAISLLKNRNESRKENYDNWQEDREFYRKVFNEMQEQVRSLSNRVVTLEQLLLKHDIPLPA